MMGAIPVIAQVDTVTTSTYCPSDPPTQYSGIGTWYSSMNEQPGTGNCAFPVGAYDPNMYAALNWSDYYYGGACGACIAAQSGGNSVTVMVVDQCPSPCNVHHRFFPTSLRSISRYGRRAD